MDADVLGNLEVASPETGPGKKWPTWFAFCVSPFMPARTASRIGPISLFKAFSMHAIGVLAAATFIGLLTAWADYDTSGGVDYTTFSGWLTSTLSEWFWEFEYRPTNAIVVTLRTIGCVEVAFLGFAFLFMSWGACDEKVRASFGNALRRLWMQTPHLALAVLTAGAVLGQLERSDHAWRKANPGPALPEPPPEVFEPSTDPANSRAAADRFMARVKFEEAVKNARLEKLKLLAFRPWSLRYSDVIGNAACLAAAGWFLWGALGAIGAPREAKPIARPPACEHCGYELTGLSMDHRCPECGLAVGDSIGLDHRSGCAWQKRKAIGTFVAMWRTQFDAVVRPRRLAKQLPLIPPAYHHRSFMAIQIAMIALTAGLVTLVVSSEESISTAFRLRERAFIGFGTVGPLVAILAVVLICATATLVGLYGRLRFGRNLMGGSIQLACYGSGYLAIAVLVAGFSFWGVKAYRFHHAFDFLDRWLGFQDAASAILMAGWSILVILLMARFLFSLLRGTSSMRFANR